LPNLLSYDTCSIDCQFFTTNLTRCFVAGDYAECIQQISLFRAGCEALKAHPGVVEALDELAVKGWTEEARQGASGALFELCPERINHKHAGRTGAGDGTEPDGHVMISYQWDVQDTIQRLVHSLQERGFRVWFDLNNMSGSIMDAMAEAVDGAEVVLYGVSLAYKESANCRLEANYAHQQQKPMIPLMMQRNFTPNGWLGLLLGTKLWYPLYDSQGVDDATFAAKLDPIVREIGDRGKVKTARISEGTPPPAQALARVHNPTQAPALASTPPGRNAWAPEAVSTAVQHMSPSLQMSPMAQQVQQPQSVASLSDIVAILREQRDEAKADRLAMEAKLERQRLDAEAERTQAKADLAEVQARMEARLEQQQAELRAELTPRPPQPAIAETQLVALQSRLERLHVAQLLSDDELYSLENLLADWTEVQASMVGQVVTESMLYSSMAGTTLAAGVKVHKMIKIAAVTTGDSTFARQIRRKFLLDL
jgi:hypothetical protein